MTMDNAHPGGSAFKAVASVLWKERESDTLKKFPSFIACRTGPEIVGDIAVGHEALGQRLLRELVLWPLHRVPLHFVYRVAEVHLVGDTVRATAVEVIAIPVEVLWYLAELLCPLQCNGLARTKVNHGWRWSPARGNGVLRDKGN